MSYTIQLSIQVSSIERQVGQLLHHFVLPNATLANLEHNVS
jgi:hypothetical protein